MYLNLEKKLELNCIRYSAQCGIILTDASPTELTVWLSFRADSRTDLLIFV